MQHYFLQTDRKVLSQVTMTKGEIVYKILKVQDLKGLSVEIYQKDTNDQFKLVDSDVLTDRKDAYYVFNKQKLNLFLKDIDNDNFPEIVLPSIDKNMSARLNIYSFNTYTGQLKKVSKH